MDLHLTGRASGIGRAVAETLAAEGARVVACDVADGDDALLVAWLCSGAASFVTGAPVLVDGGYTAR